MAPAWMHLSRIERSAVRKSFARSVGTSLARSDNIASALNTILRAQTPRLVKKGKRAYSIAIDLTLIPYHGEPYTDEKEIVCSQPKSGTTHFHGYATVSIVHDDQRYVVALRFVEKGESMETIVAWLLNRQNSIGIPIKRAYFDKGFVPCQF